MRTSAARIFCFLLQLVWLSCAVAVVFNLAANNGNTDTLAAERDLLFSILLLMLTFPIGYVWVGLNIGLRWSLDALGLIPSSSLSHPIIDFLFILVWVGLGYCQWFVAIPWLCRKWKERCLKNEASND